MDLHLNIYTIGGESLAVTAFESWLVHDLKLTIERDHKFPRSRQKLFNRAGEELRDERGLIEFCPIDMGPQTLMLVKVSKTQSEIEFSEKWLNNTPKWLQSATKSVMDNHFFSELRSRPDYQEIGHNNWGRSGTFKPGGPEPFGPRSSSPTCKPKVPAEPPRVLSTAREVLSVVTSTKLHPDGVPFVVLETEAEFVHMRRWNYSCRIEWRATLEAAIGAVAAEPKLMLRCADDSLVCSALRRYPELSRCVRERLSTDQSLLYEVLEFDAELRKEFLATAGKTEINAWLWNQKECHVRGSTTKPKVRAEPTTSIEAGTRGKHGLRCGPGRNARRAR